LSRMVPCVNFAEKDLLPDDPPENYGRIWPIGGPAIMGGIAE